MGGVSGLNRAGWHAVIFGSGRILYQGKPTGAEDGAQAQRAIGAGAGKNDANGTFLSVFRQGPQKGVNWHALAARLVGYTQLQAAMKDGHVAVGRDDIHTVGFDDDLIPRLDHRHRRDALQDLSEQAGVVGVKMRHQHVGHATIGSNMTEKLLERFQTAGRSANANDGEPGCYVFSCHARTIPRLIPVV